MYVLHTHKVTHTCVSYQQIKHFLTKILKRAQHSYDFNLIHHFNEQVYSTSHYLVTDGQIVAGLTGAAECSVVVVVFLRVGLGIDSSVDAPQCHVTLTDLN